MSEYSERSSSVQTTITGPLSRASVVEFRQARVDARRWLSLAERIGQMIDLDATALAAGALQRRRGVPSAVHLLALALMHGPGCLTLRQLSEHAQAFGIAKLSEPALLRRLLHAASWLDDIAERLTIEQLLTLNQPETPDTTAPAVLTLRPYAEWQHEARTARQFVEDLMPWPSEAFNEAQVHWLMCVRWNFVAASLRSGRLESTDLSDIAPSMQRVRRLAYLIVALLPDISA